MKRYCLISGVGTGQYEISSFDAALLDAGVGNYNLVRVSSILPPFCQKSETIGKLSGTVLFTAYACLTTGNTGKIASAVAAAIPEDPASYGVIMKYSDNADRESVVAAAEFLARDAMLRRGIPCKEVVSTGIEAEADGEKFFTTFAGIALFDQEE